MKKVNAPKTRQIWEPENHPRRLKLPDERAVFDSSAVLRAGMVMRKLNPGGQLHCDNGPAVEFQGGDLEWWRHGQLHRDGDEPAIEIKDGGSMTQWAFPRANSRKLSPFLLVPGTKVWASYGLVHRDAGPAFEMPLSPGNVYQEYWRKGRLHNSNGPAVQSNSIQIYYYHGLAHKAEGPASLFDDGGIHSRCWIWYGNMLMNLGQLEPKFPFEDPPPDYLLNALFDADFSDALVASLPLISKRVDRLMPDFQQHMANCCDPVSWALFQEHIRIALNPDAAHECFDYSFAL